MASAAESDRPQLADVRNIYGVVEMHVNMRVPAVANLVEHMSQSVSDHCQRLTLRFTVELPYK